MHALFAFLSPTQAIIVVIVAVLLFGRRLPELGRYLGKGIIEFKKGLQGRDDNIDQ
jgi:sec-independent protein translocase protein TatA